MESTPSGGDASYRSTNWSAEGHTSGQTFSVSGMNWLPCALALLPTDKLHATIQRNDTPVCIEIDSPADINDAMIKMGDEPILRRRLPRTEVFAEGVEEKCMAPYTDSRSTIHNASGRNDDYIWLPSESDHPCRRRSLPPNTAVTKVDGLVHEHLPLFRRTKFPPNRFVVSLCRYMKFVRRPDPTPEVCAAGRNGGYIRSNRGTVPSVCNEPVTGSQAHGSSHRLGRCDLVWSAIPSLGMGSASVVDSSPSSDSR